MITPELKDRILFNFVNLGIRLFTDTSKDCKDYGIDRDTYSGVLDQFERRELIRQNKYLGGAVDIIVSVDAHDFVRNGGFTAQEEILRANINKLGFEIELLCKELSPNLIDRAHKITAIGNSILSALNLMPQ